MGPTSPAFGPTPGIASPRRVGSAASAASAASTGEKANYSNEPRRRGRTSDSGNTNREAARRHGRGQRTPVARCWCAWCATTKTAGTAWRSPRAARGAQGDDQPPVPFSSGAPGQCLPPVQQSPIACFEARVPSGCLPRVTRVREARWWCHVDTELVKQRAASERVANKTRSEALPSIDNGWAARIQTRQLGLTPPGSLGLAWLALLGAPWGLGPPRARPSRLDRGLRGLPRRLAWRRGLPGRAAPPCPAPIRCVHPACAVRLHKRAQPRAPLSPSSPTASTPLPSKPHIPRPHRTPPPEPLPTPRDQKSPSKLGPGPRAPNLLPPTPTLFRSHDRLPSGDSGALSGRSIRPPGPIPGTRGTAR